MVCYPDVQKEAQAELDKVLNGRLPEHSDFPSLPYLSALVKEVFRYAAVRFKYSLLPVYCVSRCNPVFPLGRSLFLSNTMVASGYPYLFKGLPHQSTGDDLYNEYNIPAKSLVFPNQW